MRLAFLGNANSLHLKEWAEYLVHRLGHEVVIFTIPPRELDYSPQIEIVQASNTVTRWKLGWLTLLPMLRRELARRRPDLFIGYRAVSYGYLGALAGFRPYVIAPQAGDIVWPPGNRVQIFCVKGAIKRADGFNAWAPHIRDELVRFGADPARVTVLSRGIELKRFPPRSAEPPGPPRIVITRGLTPLYNIKQLISAMAILRNTLPGVHLDVVGDGMSRSALEDQSRELGLTDTITFHGHLAREAVAERLRAAHLYVSTNLTDGLPMSHFEAMAVGLFPVLSDIKANRLWVRDGENGLIFPLHRPDALAAALQRAWEDPALRTRAAAENRRLVEENFDRDVCLRRMVAGWEEIVARYRSAGAPVAV